MPAPFGPTTASSDPGATETCASCHYDYDPVMESAAITIEGLPDKIAAGSTYQLILRFAPPEARTSGFQVTTSTDGDAGSFVSGPADVEVTSTAVRSTAPRALESGVSWTVEWRAPAAVDTPIAFHVAASASNDDGSPFGDTIHYRSFSR